VQLDVVTATPSVFPALGALVTPVQAAPNGGTQIIADGTTAVNGLPGGTTVRAIQRDLLNQIPLVVPAGEATRVPGLTSVPMFTISDPLTIGPSFPAKTVRVVENDVVQAHLSGKGGTHTIHWHGIEPLPMHDGVGKQSFELSAFMYQWAANQAGTYFYHCHKNTVLHFEMGLYGLLIVDPKTPTAAGLAPPFTDGGPGCVQANVDPAKWGTRLVDSFTGKVPVVDYDAECLWVVDDIDTLWHSLGAGNVNLAMTNNFAPPLAQPINPVNPATFTHDGPLNTFFPDVFCITGKVQPGARSFATAAPVPITGAPVSATVKAGKNVLARCLNASYCYAQFTLDLDATIIDMDGRPLGIRAEGKYSKPFTIPAGRPFRYGTARRWTMLMQPPAPGVYNMKTEFFLMYRGIKVGEARTTITAT
jgi:FtsP/CotA-like multicopper oxidase with cupredoxin domain